MERNVMGELNVYRESGAKPNFSEIAVSATVKTTILTNAQ